MCDGRLSSSEIFAAGPDVDSEIPNEKRESIVKGNASTYHVLPKVLLPFDSARRRNCAALNCEARVSEFFACAAVAGLRTVRYGTVRNVLLPKQ
jgi:hypothetical protein